MGMHDVFFHRILVENPNSRKSSSFFFCTGILLFLGGEIREYTSLKRRKWRCKSMQTYISSRFLDPGSWNKEGVLSRQLVELFTAGRPNFDASLSHNRRRWQSRWSYSKSTPRRAGQSELPWFVTRLVTFFKMLIPIHPDVFVVIDDFL